VFFVQNMWKAADSSDSGAWINIKFTNSATKKIEPKKIWVRKVGDYVVSCGVYVSE
jgi:hypothetical protein